MRIGGLPELASNRIAFKNTFQFRPWFKHFSSESTPSYQLLTMPALSPTMTIGTLTQWKKAIGDAVKPGDVLAEVETDKATMDWECQEEGYIAKILLPDGSKDVPIGKPALVIVENKQDIGSISDSIISKESSAATTDQSPKESSETPEPTKPNQNKTEASIPTFKEKTLSSIEAKQQSTQNIGVGIASSTRINISPLARKLAIQNDIDLAKLKISGSGPGGRVVESDILSVLNNKGQGSTFVKSSSREMTKGITTDKPLTNMRRTIAKRLTESTTTIPHFYLTCKVDMSSIMLIRTRTNKRLAIETPNVKLSVNDFIIKACAMALKGYPSVNASWMGDSIKEYTNVDISVAVSTEEGLITPIIFQVDSLGLLDISTEVKRLAGKAKAGTLTPTEYVGGTFTISNLGMYGITSFTAIINPPQAAILAVGSTETVWKSVHQISGGNVNVNFSDGSNLVPCSEMSITLSCDHRVIDGALGAKFLGKIKSLLEDPSQMLL